MKFLIHFNRKKNKKNKKDTKKLFIMDNYSVLTHIMLIMLIYKNKPFEQKIILELVIVILNFNNNLIKMMSKIFRYLRRANAL